MGDRWALQRRASREWGKLPLVLAITCALLLALGISLALAGKGIESFFGQRGSGDGQFETPRDVAVYNGTTLNPGTGDIYVVDDNNHRVQRFDSAPPFAFEAQFGGLGTAGGQFENPQGIAISQDTGALYVRDRDNRRIQQFDPDGTLVRAWGWDVVASGPGDDVVAPVNEFEICVPANGDTCKTGISGAAAGQFATSSSVGGGIAVAPATGDVFVGDPTNRRVQHFESDGDFVRPWGSLLGLGGFDTGANARSNLRGLELVQLGPDHKRHRQRPLRRQPPRPPRGRLRRDRLRERLERESAGDALRLDTGHGGRAPRPADRHRDLGSGATGSMEVDPSTDHVVIGRGFANVLEVDTTPLRVVWSHPSTGASRSAQTTCYW